MKILIVLMALAIVSCGKTTVSWKEGEPVDKRYSNFTMEIHGRLQQVLQHHQRQGTSLLSEDWNILPH